MKRGKKARADPLFDEFPKRGVVVGKAEIRDKNMP